MSADSERVHSCPSAPGTSHGRDTQRAPLAESSGLNTVTGGMAVGAERCGWARGAGPARLYQVTHLRPVGAQSERPALCCAHRRTGFFSQSGASGRSAAALILWGHVQAARVRWRGPGRICWGAQLRVLREVCCRRQGVAGQRDGPAWVGLH